MSRISIINVAFDIINKNGAAERIFDACSKTRQTPLTVVTPNPIMVMNAQKNEALFSALADADLSLADGVGVISAAKRLGSPLPERVTGIDTAYSVIEKLNRVGRSIYLLGAKPGVAKKAAEQLAENFSSLRIVGTHHGYFEDDEEIIKDISEKSPDLLAVCLGSPRQEIWVHENKKRLSSVGAIVCLGGALDVWAGNTKRAPSLFIKLHLEWLWRMLLEPQRMKELPKMIKFRILTGKSRQNRKSFK